MAFSGSFGTFELIMNKALLQSLVDIYHSRFDETPIQIFSPGRINLIGEHTDYNNGFVLPAAIDLGIYMILGKAYDQSTMISMDFEDSYRFSVRDDLVPIPGGGWKNYILGVVQQIKLAGKEIGEFNIVFGGDIPIGSGLSSSAALENAAGVGLNALFGLGFRRMHLLKMSQKAEHDFAGVRCGIMDQFASMMGEENKAILLDCETLNYSLYPMILDEYTLLLCNSNVAHNLASSEYNIRRAQCEEGVSVLQKYYPNISTLREVSPEMLDKHEPEIDTITMKRCKYVLNENDRVHQFASDLKNGDLESAGKVLYNGHEGMKSEYEITCDEIDFLVDFTKARHEVLGARMMGGGFGGCTINLIKSEYINTFIKEIDTAYSTRWNIKMTPIEVGISGGAGVIASGL